MGKKDNYTAILLEDMRSDIKAILEIVAPMRKELTELRNRYDEDIPSIQADIKVLKAAMIKTNQNFTEHERKHGWLKAKPA